MSRSALNGGTAASSAKIDTSTASGATRTAAETSALFDDVQRKLPEIIEQSVHASDRCHCLSDRPFPPKRGSHLSAARGPDPPRTSVASAAM